MISSLRTGSAFRITTMLTVGFFAMSSANAQTSPELKACFAIADNVERLACFDAIGRASAETPQPVTPNTAASDGVMPSPDPVPPLIQRQTPPRIVTPSQPAPAEVADAIPLPPDSPLLRKERADDAPRTISQAITSVRTSKMGKTYFLLEDGQVWKQVESRKLRFPEGGNVMATIKPALLGSYMMSVDRNGKTKLSGIRVTRVR